MGWVEIMVRCAAGVALILANAFFVAIEFALTRLRQFDEDELPDHPGVRRAWEMTEKLEIYLTGCQVGISLTSIVLGVVAEPAFTTLLRPLFEWIGVPTDGIEVVSIGVGIVLLNFIHKIWGEQTPTYLGVERPVDAARFLALPLYWWVKAMYPIIIAGDGIAKWTLRLFGVEVTRSWAKTDEEGAELRGEAARAQLADVLARSRVSKERRREVLKAFELGETPVSEIMIPIDDAVALDIDRPFDENLRRVRESGYTRFPLVGEDVDDYRGIIYVPALLQHLDDLHDGKPLEDLAADPMTVPADTKLDRLIDCFQEEGQELALVEDAGHICGLVTVTDVFEAVIGDLEDPLD